MANIKKIGVLTSGGDAPGMNAAIRSVTRAAISYGVEVVGIYRGYRGLIDGDLKVFTARDVSNIINDGGTMLYSDRCLEFKTPEGMAKAVATCEKYEIDGIVCIGGDGTFKGAIDLTRNGIPAIALPGTIDNDITSTDYTIGFDTAVNTTIEMVDRLRDTCESHARCNVVEVMGRNCGDIALYAGIATGATEILIPEINIDESKMIAKIMKYKKAGRRNFIIMVSEGLGSEYCESLTKKIESETGIETKFARLAHVVRGGSPTLRDRFLGARMGVKAVEELLAGNSNLVICENDDQIVSLDIEIALALDKMYKGKLKDGDLDKFTPEQIEFMKARCLEARNKVERLSKIAETISK